MVRGKAPEQSAALELASNRNKFTQHRLQFVIVIIVSIYERQDWDTLRLMFVVSTRLGGIDQWTWSLGPETFGSFWKYGTCEKQLYKG